MDQSDQKKKKSVNIVTKIIGKVQISRFSEMELIEGIKNRRAEIIRYMKTKNIGSVRKMINHYNPGRYMEAEDVIQEALVILIDKLQFDEFNKLSKINTFFLGICKNICLKAYRETQQKPLIYDGDKMIENEAGSLNQSGDNVFLTDDVDPKALLVLTIEIIKTMQVSCVEIFDLRFGLLQINLENLVFSEKKKFSEIADILQISEVNARKRYSRCFEYLYSEFRKRSAAFN